MSVNMDIDGYALTEADDYLEYAKEAIDSAIQHLSEITVDKCSGHENYNLVTMQNAVFNLILVLAKLENMEKRES